MRKMEFVLFLVLKYLEQRGDVISSYEEETPFSRASAWIFSFFNYKMWVLISWWLKLISQMFFEVDGEILGQR